MTDPPVPAGERREEDRLRHETVAARSAAEFVRRYARECCRHAEAVSECPHCNLNFLASYATRAADYFAALPAARPEPPAAELWDLVEDLECGSFAERHRPHMLDSATCIAIAKELADRLRAAVHAQDEGDVGVQRVVDVARLAASREDQTRHE